MSAWNLDPTHSEVQFKVKHLVISTVTGSFNQFESHLSKENENWENANVNFSVDVNSIDTNNVDRDGHLKSADFFDVANHPNMTFISTEFKMTSENIYNVTGNLTIKGVTQEVTLIATFGGEMVDPYGNHKAGFEVTGEISRESFGLTWNAVTEAGGVVVGNNVKLTFNVQYVLNK
jgi:polyisoprenoid-binding protein YceI